MASFPENDWCADVHRRVCAGDPTASADIWTKFYEPLVGWLEHKRRTTDVELIRDAAVRALGDYIKKPNGWRSERGKLVPYMCMAADRDLLNLLESTKGRRAKEILVSDVEEADLPRNVTHEDPTADSADDGFLSSLNGAVTSEVDRALVALMLAGERSTEKFAAVLGLAAKSKIEKARVVKQHKDRLKKVMERLRAKRDAH